MNPPALGVYNISSVYSSNRPRRRETAKSPEPTNAADDARTEEALIDALAHRIMARLDQFATTGPPIRLAVAEQALPIGQLQHQQQMQMQQRDDGVWIAIVALACVGLAMFFMLMSRIGRLETAVTTSQWMTMMRLYPATPATPPGLVL